MLHDSEMIFVLNISRRVLELGQQAQSQTDGDVIKLDCPEHEFFYTNLPKHFLQTILFMNFYFVYGRLVNFTSSTAWEFELHSQWSTEHVVGPTLKQQIDKLRKHLT